MARRKPEGQVEVLGEEGDEDPALMAAAEDLISAIHAKDAKAVISALSSALDILDSAEPEEEDMGDMK